MCQKMQNLKYHQISHNNYSNFLKQSTTKYNPRKDHK